MKKKFAMENVDCAHCAQKMENAIKKLDGVNDAAVSFFAQKLTIDAEDNKFDNILKEAVKCVQNVDADAKIIF